MKRSSNPTHPHNDNLGGKNPIMVEAGKKAALTRKNAIYKLEDHFENLDTPTFDLFNTVRKYIISIDR